MANYDYFMELERERRGQEPQLPSYLQYRPGLQSPPPAVTEYPDIPYQPNGLMTPTPTDRAAMEAFFAGGRGGQTGKTINGEDYYIPGRAPSPPPQDDYASKMEMGRKIIDKAMAKGIPIAEIKQYLQMKGYDMEPSKPMEVEAGKTVVDTRSGKVIYKAEPEAEKLPSKIEEFEMLFPEMKGRRGTEEYREAFGTMKPSEGLGFGDKEIIKKTLTEIPKLKREATTAATSIDQIDKALALSATGVTGKGGQLKAFLAPYVEAIGTPSESMNDAQKYQLLTRAIIGPMRLEIVGPGPVSEWEQKLMQQISGGGGAAKEAAQELLSHWKRLSENRLDAYNDTLTGFSEIYPAVTKVYKPIERKKVEAQPGAAATVGGAGGSKFDKFMK